MLHMLIRTKCKDEGSREEEQLLKNSSQILVLYHSRTEHVVISGAKEIAHLLIASTTN